MPGSPSQDLGDGAVTPPANQPGTFDFESLLSELTKTEIGADSLAKALKDRRTRDVLKQRGVKIQADDDVGYNSLPLELRDNIRSFVIADAHHEHSVLRCRCCLRLAPYACIDAEWRDAVEAVTFHRLILNGANEGLTKNLTLLERYIVGNRRKYLQHICLRIRNLAPAIRVSREVDELPEEDKVHTVTSPILQVFNCVAQWHESGTGNGNLRFEILPAGQNNGGGNEARQAFAQRVHTGLVNLPTAPQIVYFRTLFGDALDTISILALLSRMPRLRAIAVLVMPNLFEFDQDNDSQIQLFYNSLSHIAPNLEGLEVKCSSGWSPSNELQVMFCTASFSFSQRLRKLSFGKLTLPILRTILAPFSTASFKSYAPPPLAWPDLTHFTIGEFHFEMEDEIYVAINELMLTVGRAIRYMPRIQHLDMAMSYVYRVQENNGMTFTRRATKIALDLQSSRHSHDHNPVAKLCVTHYMDSDLPEAVPFRNVVDLWEKSLSYAANALLEVQVVSQPLIAVQSLGYETLEYEEL
ncbi:hypothetical protein INS49_012017 [Diaporthe citri]|uniref:uncharacterized protein n=1 Tax=Diaporthe citri TaxID=83186 RepID=UPI001C8045BA|nr:uncharacterized protein INS49_012017 [Diaporthe citri]KAG6360949.1 hypothetical protein INS49_012017 [Diaporthe citri]